MEELWTLQCSTTDLSRLMCDDDGELPPRRCSMSVARAGARECIVGDLIVQRCPPLFQTAWRWGSHRSPSPGRAPRPLCAQKDESNRTISHKQAVLPLAALGSIKEQ
ncbi:hypothetical protein SKAU_G00328070 [Synaphobranchus kaupii]|uniref:Uncharacterized protein n=1 Tax=Synaphobranchus kaupii TaxID=118154 RepID=A0A9Q1EQ43_SYNKA|nr:hypothetical protein SKAU_G00328070 [Synaphobranchus kaupii]